MNGVQVTVPHATRNPRYYWVGGINIDKRKYSHITSLIAKLTSVDGGGTCFHKSMMRGLLSR